MIRRNSVLNSKNEFYELPFWRQMVGIKKFYVSRREDFLKRDREPLNRY